MLTKKGYQCLQFAKGAVRRNAKVIRLALQQDGNALRYVTELPNTTLDTNEIISDDYHSGPGLGGGKNGNYLRNMHLKTEVYTELVTIAVLEGPNSKIEALRYVKQEYVFPKVMKKILDLAAKSKDDYGRNLLESIPIAVCHRSLNFAAVRNNPGYPTAMFMAPERPWLRPENCG